MKPLLVPIVVAAFAAALSAQTREPQAGDSTHSLQFGGRTRTYLLHLPPAVATKQPMPS